MRVSLLNIRCPVHVCLGPLVMFILTEQYTHTHRHTHTIPPEMTSEYGYIHYTSYLKSFAATLHTWAYYKSYLITRYRYLLSDSIVKYKAHSQWVTPSCDADSSNTTTVSHYSWNTSLQYNQPCLWKHSRVLRLQVNTSLVYNIQGRPTNW